MKTPYAKIFFWCAIFLSIFIWTSISEGDYIPRNIPRIEKHKIEILYCESGFHHYGVWGKAGEYGIAQFKQSTFNEFKNRANYPQLRWESLRDQLWLFNWMIDNGYSYHWTCAKKHFKVKKHIPSKHWKIEVDPLYDVSIMMDA